MSYFQKRLQSNRSSVSMVTSFSYRFWNAFQHFHRREVPLSLGLKRCSILEDISEKIFVAKGRSFSNDISCCYGNKK